MFQLKTSIPRNLQSDVSEVGIHRGTWKGGKKEIEGEAAVEAFML